MFMLVIVFFLFITNKKKAKIIAEIDVIIKNNELTDFADELLHSKKAKKKYEWYNMI